MYMHINFIFNMKKYYNYRLNKLKYTLALNYINN